MTQGIESNNFPIKFKADDIIEKSIPFIVRAFFSRFFLVTLFGTFMFIALDKHKFPSNKIHIRTLFWEAKKDMKCAQEGNTIKSTS